MHNDIEYLKKYVFGKISCILESGRNAVKSMIFGFVRNTQYNKNEVIDKAMQGCTVGLSRMKFLACNHYSPLEAISILEFETENGIDELFIPLATAYTQSGEEAQQGEKGEVGEGRPKNADNKDTSKGVGDNPNSTK